MKQKEEKMVGYDEWKSEYDEREIDLKAQSIIDKTDKNGYLYLSSLHVAHNESDLKHLDIEYVLTITHDKSLSDKVALKNKENKMHISINDKVEDETIKIVNELFPVSTKWIHEKLTVSKKNVLVHCSSGISRSSSMVIWYLISQNKMNLMDAFKFVFDKRPVILPNDALFTALQQKEMELFEELSMDKNCYNAYSLCSMLKFLNVDLKECQTALKSCNYDVMQAAQFLQQQKQ